jgi:hypothetical protein
MRARNDGVPPGIYLPACWWLVLMVITGCAAEPVKVPSVRAQAPAPGMVTLTYEYAPDEPRDPDWDRAARKARRYCREQGYDEAEILGEPEEACQADNRYRRCTLHFISRSWQCRDSE